MCNENQKKQTRKEIKNGHTRLLEGGECRRPSMKEQKEDCFVARDIESLFIKGTNNVVNC